MPFVYGQQVSISASLSAAKIGVQGQVTLTVKVTSAIQGIPDPVLPSLKDFSVYSSGTSTSISMGMGRTSISKDYSYTLVAKKEGTFTIAPVMLKVQGKVYKTKPLQIQVVKGAARAQPRQGQQQLGQTRQGTKQQIFIKATLDRATVYVNQQVTLTYELYTNVRLSGASVKEMPRITGFWSEDLTVPKNKSQSYVTIKGQQFLKAIIKKTALFPLSPGKLTIKPMTVTVQQDDFFTDPFASFFSRRARRSRPHNIKSNEVSLKVLPIPQKGKPADFKGTIGNYSITAKVDKASVKAGEPITLTLRIGGTGNIKTIIEPVLPVKGDFEKYDSGSSVKIFNKNYRVQGHKVFKYVYIPKSAGQHEIGSARFTYFSPKARKYITKNTKVFAITATPGEKQESGEVVISGISRENLKVLDKDILFIKIPAQGLVNQGDAVFTKTWFLVLQVAPLLLLLGVFLFQRQSERLQQDVGYARSRRAHRMAKKRLARARKLMQGASADAFCSGVSKALTDYIGDKLNIAGTGATTLKITGMLEEKGVKPEVIEQYRTCFEFCDFGRFAPASVSADDMIKKLAAAEEAIVALERENI